ncbi:MAG TPA: DUF5777 family beta-barrel protein [Vicinamibacterales bacterium]|jgi:hypothetical protein|nr:DUF5777 family beta-barrel protein [Vicinamibacterales bacterium]
MKIRTKVFLACLVLALAGCPAAALAQDPTPPQPPPQAPPQSSDPDSRLDPLQPDFNLAALPTTLRLPSHKSAFRVTHRFTRSLGRGDLSDLFSDFFGFDSGAQIGLEFRYGLRPGTQVGVNRTSERSIEIFGRQSVLKESADGHPLGLDVLATLEGQNNMRDKKSSALGLLASKKVGKFAALYVEPMIVVNTNPEDGGAGVDNNTIMIGLGGRLRIRPSLYLVGEVTPRVGGYKPGVDQGSFGIEMRSGGHSFQINFSNGFGTTMSQLAAGGISGDSWFIGFNISRKFF